MEIIDTELDGLKLVKDFKAEDQRGVFTKLYNEALFDVLGLDFEIKEQYYSISNKDVIRGMHFQTPPFDHHKLVHVIRGSVLDVVVDLRKDSLTYRKAKSFLLKSGEPYSLYIPKGVAHGFRSLEDNTIMLYNVSSIYSKNNDSGIRWDSIDFDWGIMDPIVSQRDNSFEALETFVSPF